MSYATIMVQVDLDGEMKGHVPLAARLAERFQSHLIGACSWMPPPVPATAGVMIDSDRGSAWWNRDNALRQRGDVFKAATGLDPQRLSWRWSAEFPADHIAREARAADLVVISRERQVPDPYEFPDPGALILRSGRPILAVPPEVQALNGRRVVIAWKDTREARRAVTDALPFLHFADETIIVEVCDDTDDLRACQKRLHDVTEYLARHRIMAVSRVHPAEGDTANTLIDVAKRENADLIVVGAYGHSRLGEWIFGGVTQGLLARSPVCCLFSH